MSGRLVTGTGGMPGREVCARLAGHGRPVLPPTRADLDLTGPAAVPRALVRAAPAAVVDRAARTDIDGARTAEAGALGIPPTYQAHVRHRGRAASEAEATA